MNSMNPPLDRFSQPMPYENRDIEREREIEEEKAEQQLDIERSEPNYGN